MQLYFYLKAVTSVVNDFASFTYFSVLQPCEVGKCYYPILHQRTETPELLLARARNCDFILPISKSCLY